MKANQHFTFFTHIPHRQTGSVAVAPGGAFNWPQHVVGFEFADVRQRIF